MLATKQSSYAAIPQRQPQVRRPEPKRTVSSQPKTFGRLDRMSIVGCIVAVAMVFWGLAAASAHITEMNRSIDTLTIQSKQLAARNSTLTSALDQSLSPERVFAAEAKQGQPAQNPIVIPSNTRN